MWKVDPKIMCRQHLLGEHLETHMFLGSIVSGKSVDGFLTKGLLEIHNLQSRHDELVGEMTRRGYRHISSLIIPSKVAILQIGYIDEQKSLQELLSRCPKCRRNYETR
ncbi:hypothetical protein C4577_01590 [Candidatus Parcubacteria bacterium]|nr:MAG: hypothetical protein C4577_01590 [Candidatus Parcubacteria bacterium]